MSRTLISVADALSLVLRHAPIGKTERVPLAEACGRSLAETVTSDVDSPPHDKSIVDGFAVRAADLVDGRAELDVSEEIMAGMVPQREVGAGQTARIMTGAPLPMGADAVVMLERTTTLASGHQGRVKIDEPAFRAGQNIVRRGAVMRRDDAVIAVGRRLRPIEIGLLAEVGCGEVAVYRRPTVAVLATGNELVPHNQQPGPGQIRNSNGPMLAAAVERAGGLTIELAIGRDDPAQLRESIRAGLDADILLVSGGVSAGDLDLAPGLFRELGVEEVFHKVRLKPGKPLWFGVRHAERETLVFGLPGNPVSSLVCFLLFGRPAMSRFLGLAENTMVVGAAKLGAPYSQRGPRATYAPARLEWNADGPVVTPLKSQGSGDLKALTDANALALFPPGDREFAAGEMIEMMMLDPL